jgi:hypothetical protein
MGAGDAPLRSVNCSEDEDAAFLRHLADTSTTGKALSTSRKIEPNKLELQEANVAKVVRDGITSLSFMPSATVCALAVVDKHGHVCPSTTTPSNSHTVHGIFGVCKSMVGEPVHPEFVLEVIERSPVLLYLCVFSSLVNVSLILAICALI